MQRSFSEVQMLLQQSLQLSQSFQCTLYHRSNLSTVLAILRNPYTSELHLRRVMDAMIKSSSSTQWLTLPNHHIPLQVLFNYALVMMKTSRYYDAFKLLHTVLQRQEQQSPTWTLTHQIKLLLRTAECCIYHHKTCHQSPSGKAALQLQVLYTKHRKYQIIK